MNKTKKIAYYGLFTATATVLGYLDAMIPMPIPVAGVKLGLANVTVLCAMYFFGEKEALGVSLARLALAMLLYSGLAGFLYSLAGALLSFAAMAAAKRLRAASVIGVSVVGGIFHNIGQIAVACIVVKNWGLLSYLSILIPSGIITGALTGAAAKEVLKRKNKL